MFVRRATTWRATLAFKPLAPTARSLNSLCSVDSPTSLRQRESRIFIPSPEQLRIVKACRTGNVMVSARPGAGKTATAEALCQANPTSRIAIITYSKRLQVETARRLEAYPFVDVYTFHGLAGKLYGQVIHNDSILHDLRVSSAPPTAKHLLDYEYVVLDELQDLTDDLYWLTCNFALSVAHARGVAPRILALGDPRQAIFEYRGADARFLQNAPDVLSSISSHTWNTMNLDKSFRLSEATAAFVNHAFLGEEYITGTHTGPKPLYINGNLTTRDDVEPLLDHLLPLIAQYGPENSALLSSYVRDNSFLKWITRRLSYGHRIPMAVATADDQPIDEDVVRGKLAVSSYHGFKGLERDLVIVCGADNSYFKYMGRSLPDDRCPNATFVALTRAAKRLVVLQSDRHSAMPFVNWEAVEQHAEFVNLPNSELLPQAPPGRPQKLGLLLPSKISVTDAIRHIPSEQIDTLAAKHLRIVKLAGRSSLPIDAPDKVLTNWMKRHYEAVSDLNGLAVAAAFEWNIKRTMSTFHLSPEKVAEIPEDETERTIWLSREACKYEAKTSGYVPRSRQLGDHSFDWLVRYMPEATARLSREFSANHGVEAPAASLTFEVPLKRTIIVNDTDTAALAEKTTIGGRADIVHQHSVGALPTIWEIKFVHELVNAHAIQVAFYGYLWAGPKQVTLPKMLLYNVRDGEKWGIQTDLENARLLIEGILRARYTSNAQTPTDVFLNTCEKTKKQAESAAAR